LEFSYPLRIIRSLNPTTHFSSLGRFV